MGIIGCPRFLLADCFFGFTQWYHPFICSIPAAFAHAAQPFSIVFCPFHKILKATCHALFPPVCNARLQEWEAAFWLIMCMKKHPDFSECFIFIFQFRVLFKNLRKLFSVFLSRIINSFVSFDVHSIPALIFTARIPAGLRQKSLKYTYYSCAFLPRQRKILPQVRSNIGHIRKVFFILW